MFSYFETFKRAALLMLSMASIGAVLANDSDLLNLDLDEDDTVDELSAVSKTPLSHGLTLSTMIDEDIDVQHLKATLKSDFQHKDASKEIKIEMVAAADVVDIAGIQSWSSATRKEYEGRLDVRNAWLALPLSDYSKVTIGRQTKVTGNADILRQVDVFNALDVLYPGNTNLNELRLPRAALQYKYSKDVDVALVYAFEQRFTKLPTPGSRYALSSVAIDKNVKENFNANDVMLNILVDKFGVEHQLQATKFLYLNPIVTLDAQFKPRANYYNVQQYSLANKFVGNKVEVFSELSHIRPSDKQDPRSSANNYLVGVVYRGLTNTQLQAELSKNNFDKQQQLALNIRRTWLNDALKATATHVATRYPNKAEGDLYSLLLAYELNDDVNVQGRWVVFREDPNSPLAAWNKKDHWVLELKKTF